MISRFVLFAILATFAVTARASDGKTRVVIYDSVATEVSPASEPSNDLWITTSDLTRATRFVIKPQGVCRDELCFPLPKNRKAEFVLKKGATTCFNLLFSWRNEQSSRISCRPSPVNCFFQLRTSAR